jgi:hypothetical protein
MLAMGDEVAGADAVANFDTGEANLWAFGGIYITPCLCSFSFPREI